MGFKGSSTDDVSIVVSEEDELFERLNATFKAIIDPPEVGLLNVLRDLLEALLLFKFVMSCTNRLKSVCVKDVVTVWVPSLQSTSL